MSQSQHIIIVDDEAPAREMVGDYLKMHGFTVTLCDGGKSLRSAIDTGPADLVVLDTQDSRFAIAELPDVMMGFKGGRKTFERQRPTLLRP